MKKLKRFLIELEKERLDKGLDTSGKVVGTYSFATEQIAKTQNPIKPKVAGQPFNFQYEGDFFKEMEIVFSATEAVFTNKDSKAKILTAKYDDLLGYSDEDWNNFLVNRLYPAFMSQFRSKTGL